jgi:hypothetical protein
MELANEAGVKIETINFIKLPPGLHGLKALQLALHELLCTMGKANYSATTSLVSITSETCGTDLLKRLNDTISPKSGDNTKQAKNKSTIQAHPERKEALAPDLKLLTTPSPPGRP